MTAGGEGEFRRLTFDPLAQLVQVVHGAGFAYLDLGLVALQGRRCREGLLQGQHHLIHLKWGGRTKMDQRTGVGSGTGAESEVFCVTHQRLAGTLEHVAHILTGTRLALVATDEAEMVGPLDALRSIWREMGN